MPMTSAQGIERERKRTAARMAQKRAEREAAERAARGDDLQVNGADTQGEDSQPGAAGSEVIPAPKVPFYQHSPSWRKHAGLVASAQQSGNDQRVSKAESAQTIALDALAEHAVQAATYIGRVATGRAKGEQWRMRAAADVLDRIGATAATVDRQRERAAGADVAALAPLLARLAQAQALAARKAGATDAETGQTSGTPSAE